MSSSTDVISLTDGTPAKRKALPKDPSSKTNKKETVQPAPGKESTDAFTKLITDEEKAKGRHYFLVKGYKKDGNDNDDDDDDDDEEEDEEEDEDEEDKGNASLAELLDEKNGVKYLMLTEAAIEAVYRAKRVVGDVMYGDRRPHEIIRAIETKTYVPPTAAEAKTWSVGTGNTSSSYAYYAIFEMETKASLALLRKGDGAGAFNALLGVTLAASQEDLWLLDLEDPLLPAACIKALGAAWKKVLALEDGALQLDVAQSLEGGRKDRAVLEEKLTAIAKDWATYDTFGDPAYKFVWKPPVKRQPKAAAAVGQEAASSSSSSSSSSSVAATCGAPANALAPYATLRSEQAKKHVLHLRVSSAEGEAVCEVCVFDHVTAFNLHRTLAHAIHAASKGAAKEEALDARPYRFSAEAGVVVGVAKAPGVTANGRTAKATSLDWSAPVTYVLFDGDSAAAASSAAACSSQSCEYRVECVDVAPVLGIKKAGELRFKFGSEQSKVERAFKEEVMPRCVRHEALGVEGVGKANEKLIRLRFHQNHAMNKTERTGLGRDWIVFKGTTSAHIRQMKENFYRGDGAKDIAEVRRGRY